MLGEASDLLNQGLVNLPAFMTILQIMINLLFAGAVAKDSGRLLQTGQPNLLVNGITWAFATLVGGVFVAVAYWIIHHSTLTRVSSSLHSLSDS